MPRVESSANGRAGEGCAHDLWAGREGRLLMSARVGGKEGQVDACSRTLRKASVRLGFS